MQSFGRSSLTHHLRAWGKKHKTLNFSNVLMRIHSSLVILRFVIRLGDELLHFSHFTSLQVCGSHKCLRHQARPKGQWEVGEGISMRLFCPAVVPHATATADHESHTNIYQHRHTSLYPFQIHREAGEKKETHPTEQLWGSLNWPTSILPRTWKKWYSLRTCRHWYGVYFCSVGLQNWKGGGFRE